MTSVGSYLSHRHLLGLAVDGQDIPMTMSDIMELVIVENVSKRLPAFRLRYKDRTGFLHDNAPISDGSKMGIVMHSGNMSDPEKPQDMTFRIMGCEAVPAGDAVDYRISGTLDNMKYLRGIAKMPYNDTSKGALGQIAKEVGLKFEGDGTNDKMPWLPRNQTQFFCDFASFIRVHGRNDSKSAMSLGVSDDGRMIYKDLNKAVTQGGKRTIRAVATGAFNNGDIPYVHWEVKNINGFANLMHGQGAQILQEQQGGTAEIFGLIESLFSGGALNVSKSISALLGGDVLKEYVPYNAGNCQSGDTLVATENGLLRLDQIGYNKGSCPINLMVGGRFKPARAKTWHYSGIKKIIIVETEKGNTLRGTASHPNLVFSEHSGQTEWKKNRDCRTGDLLCMNPHQVTRQKPLPLNLNEPKIQRLSHNLNTCHKPDNMTSELASLLGYIVSEGCVDARYVRFSNSSSKILNHYKACMEKVFGLSCSKPSLDAVKGENITVQGIKSVVTKNCYRLSTGSVRLVGYLKQLGIVHNGFTFEKSKNKEIPWSILQADTQSQMAFLAAYLEGDGTIASGRLAWYSSSETLLKQMQILLNSHGCSPTFSRGFTAHRLTLGRTDSQTIWPSLAPFMVSKSLKNKIYRSNEGVPLRHWIEFINARRVIGTGRRANGCFYFTDNDSIVNILWKSAPIGQLTMNTIYKKRTFTYQNFKQGRYRWFLSQLKKISLLEYDKLVHLLEQEYRFCPIKSITEGIYQPVYDLSMSENEEPAFTANGLIIHNTHEQFYQAKNQNIRGTQLFSNIVEVLTTQATGLHIYDTVQFEPTLPSTNKIATLYAGSYVVSARTRYIDKKNYYEKIRMQSNTGGSGGKDQQGGQ